MVVVNDGERVDGKRVGVGGEGGELVVGKEKEGVRVE